MRTSDQYFTPLRCVDYILHNLVFDLDGDFRMKGSQPHGDIVLTSSGLQAWERMQEGQISDDLISLLQHATLAISR